MKNRDDSEIICTKYQGGSLDQFQNVKHTLVGNIWSNNQWTIDEMKC